MGLENKKRREERREERGGERRKMELKVLRVREGKFKKEE